MTILLVTGVWGYLAYKHHKERQDYLRAHRDTQAPEEREVILWYAWTLRRKVKFDLFMMALIDMLIWFSFPWDLSSLRESGVPPFIGYFSLMLSVAAMFKAIWVIGMTKRRSITKAMSADQRAPVLFLRSFKHDGQSSIELYNPFTNKGQKIFTLESHALAWTGKIGPVIAVASPYAAQEVFLIAARERYQDWEEQVSVFMKMASLIVMIPDHSAGLLWEFDRIVELEYLQKTVLHIHSFPENEEAEALSDLGRFAGIIEERHQIKLKLTGPRFSKVFFDAQGQPQYTTNLFDIPIFRKAFYKGFLEPKMAAKRRR